MNLRLSFQVCSEEVVVRNLPCHVFIVKRKEVEELLLIQVDLEFSHNLPELKK